jgi:CheY-like chemotaxis protein
VFVVDDERVNRTLLAAVLGRWGLEPTMFANGQLVVDALTRRQTGPASAWPVLMTLDVEMPILDGRQVLAHIRRRVRAMREKGQTALAHKLESLPVVVVTGNARASDRKQLERLGAKAVLRKPVDPDELQLTIHEVVDAASLPSLTDHTGLSGSTEAASVGGQAEPRVAPEPGVE